MRKVMWSVAVLAVAWSGWWAVASTGLRGGVQAWIDARAAEGWQAEVSDIEGGGFPLQLRAGLTDLALADPEAGLAVQTARIDIAAPAWWPGDVVVTLDDGPMLVASPLGRNTVVMQDGRMALNLHPGTALKLEAMGWTSGPWSVATPGGPLAQADDLTLTMTQTQGAAYDLVASATGFAPGDGARQGLRLPDGFPRAFDSLQVQAAVTFDTEWDRSALDTRRPQPRQITLHRAEAHWGLMQINIAADLIVDANGTPEGIVALQAQNWRSILDLAEASGTLPAALRRQAEGVLQALAGASGNENSLDVTLTLRGGVIALGFIPLLPAPRIVLR
jgi:hypothetical protein